MAAAALLASLPAAMISPPGGEASASRVLPPPDSACRAALEEYESATGRRPEIGAPHSLSVGLSDDSVRLRWLTVPADSGTLVITRGDRVRKRRHTLEGLVHEVRLSTVSSRDRLHFGPSRTGEGLTLEVPPLDARDRFRVSMPDSLFVVGDVHGQLYDLRSLLLNAGVVDSVGRWSAGRSRLVLLGDVMDRGPEVTATLWFAYRLEQQAERAGGDVHVVLGNHELMVMTGDLRYVPPSEKLLARCHGVDYPALFHPGRTLLGRWLASRPSVLRVGPVLLAHGGVSPAYGDRSLEALNDSLWSFMREPLFRRLSDSTVAVPRIDSAAVARRLDLIDGSSSPLWFRGWMESDTLSEALDRILDRHGARVHVVGHTPVPTVTERYGGRVIAVDMQRPATALLLLTRGRGGTIERRVIRQDGPAFPLR